MRLWTIHPKYLDSKGLVALWREGLLAQKALKGETRGYANHSQLRRFKLHENPVKAIGYYLSHVQKEATRRGYKFDRTKIDYTRKVSSIKTTVGQVNFERRHLLNKLIIRDMIKFYDLRAVLSIEIHPSFYPVHGEIEEWEIL